MTQRLPLAAILLGLAGLIPFVACTIGAIGSSADLAQQSLTALIAYGAVILAFLGGVQWGFFLAPAPQGVTPAMLEVAAATNPPAPQQRGVALRLVVGVLPSLLGWAALLMPLALPQIAGLAVLIAGFLFAAGADSHAARERLIPTGYLWLRWMLTIVVVALLTTVLTLRVLGIFISY